MTREERIVNLKILKSRITVFDEDDNKQVKALQETIKELEQEPKTGHWILTSDDEYEYCTCSECGYQNGENWMIGSQIKFCPNCGVKMVMAESEE